ISQALGAVSRASIHLARGSIKVDPIVSTLADEDLCKGCGLCAALCPYGAIEIIDTPKGKKASMISVACKGCGVCGATCYHRAIKMNHFTNEQVGSQIAAVVGK
ncbi:MAG: 4Fe-4S ferredoxin, partial [Deltaproteobacteria bacterium CG06_land_8_20_14_3_00_44_19]